MTDKPDTVDSKPKRTRRADRPLTPDELAALAGPAPVSSMTLAQAHRVDPANYPQNERQAAKLDHALDFGLNRNATDALSFVQATGWPGFQILGMLAQLPEYRSMHERLADETVRTWGKVTSTSKDEQAVEKITKLTQALERFGVRNLFRTAVIHDQAYGGAHILPHIADGLEVNPVDSPLLLSPTFVKPGSLKSLSAVEPLWVTPNDYNATDPTKADFYKPRTWMMIGSEVHASRLYTMISRPVSDLLKAVYSFRGVSMTQLAMPYVDNWLRTRQSVSDTVKQFSVTALMTDMSQMLQPGGATSLAARAQLFNVGRDNRNLAIADKATEEFVQVNTPLSGLDNLQAQSQEQMAAVCHMPLVILTGITPAGLNANSDGEIRVWYDYVAGYQSTNGTPLMRWLLQLIQLSEFGEVDPGLSWEWNPLYELDDKELAEVREKNARTDLMLVEMQAVTDKDVQKRLQQDPTSGYSGILTEKDDLDEIRDLAEAAWIEAVAPQPQEPTDGPDTDQPNAEAAPAGGDRSGNDA
jgi:phage-related protein (TIGR01555 family)